MTLLSAIVFGVTMFTQLNPNARPANVLVPGNARSGETRADVVARERKESAEWPHRFERDCKRAEREAEERRSAADARRAAAQAAARQRTGICERIVPDGDMVRIPLQVYRVQRRLVTQRQWEKVMGTNPSAVKGPDRPVTGVTKAEGREFARRAGELDGQPYALVCMRQWEYACRALQSEANWRHWMETGVYLDQRPDEPNAYGILDTNGTIVEWLDDAPDLHPLGRAELASCGLRLSVEPD